MKTSLSVDWLENMSFGTEINGHSLVVDAAPEGGGQNKGPRPKALMMLALAGCTGMDVVAILAKMRVVPEKFTITVETEMTEEHPKHYTHMHVIYQFRGEDLPLDKLEKAISLSIEKYCGVMAVYKKAIKMTHEIRVLD